MIDTSFPLAPELCAPAPAPDPAPLLEQVATLRLENAALRAQNAALQERIRELEARLGQNSSNSSRPPASDPPQAPRNRPEQPSGHKRGGQPGHRGAFRRLLPVEEVDEVVVVVPERCGHCGQQLPAPASRRRGRVWRHQVVELLPLAVRVTEYQMTVRRCPACGKRTRAALPAGVPRRPFGPRLTAVIALLSGRYRLSRREVRQLLQDLWEVKLSLGTVVRQEQVQSAALTPIVEEARAAVQDADVVNMALCWAHLKRAFQGLVDRGGEAAPIGRWGLAEIERLFALWHRFRAGEFDRQELRRRLIPLQARMGRLLRLGQENPDRQAAALCRELSKWWTALWTFARVEGVEPTNNVAERALRPAVLWRKGSFGSDSEAGSRFTERLLTVAATCRQQGRSLLGFLVAAVEAALQGTGRPSLLPAPQGN